MSSNHISFQDLGVKTDSDSAKKFFHDVDFDSDGVVDLHGWNHILDDHVKLGQLFQVISVCVALKSTIPGSQHKNWSSRTSYSKSV